MLLVTVQPQEASGPLSVRPAPTGHSFKKGPEGRTAELWWTLAEVDDSRERDYLVSLVPGVDHVVVFRRLDNGSALHVLSGRVVSAWQDGTTVNMTVLEAPQEEARQRPAAAPQPVAQAVPQPVGGQPQGPGYEAAGLYFQGAAAARSNGQGAAATMLPGQGIRPVPVGMAGQGEAHTGL
jgi:hypothetical protein